MTEDPEQGPATRASWRQIGPGIVIAATGVGAGDLVASARAGAELGLTILWAVVLGALLKLALNEGLARWQLATGTTLIEGWMRHLPTWVSVYFFLYLVLWAFLVAGGLTAACGLAAHALFPGLSVMAWGVLHSLAALALVWLGRYLLFERVMKGLIAVMFVVVLACAAISRPDWSAVVSGLTIPRLPEGGLPFVLALCGGVGGSVTLLAYGYWIRERGWQDAQALRTARLDLGIAYGLTAVFGVALVMIASGIGAESLSGNAMALALADRFGEIAGPVLRLVFLTGFWGAVFSSLLGVYQGVPYLFADSLHCWRQRRADRFPPLEPGMTRGPAYRGFLLFMALLPLTLLLVDRPVWIVLIYAIAGSFFMPFLAGTLLVLNNRRAWIGNRLGNGWLANVGLAAALILFFVLMVRTFTERL
ncbi:MAG: Nramp family divalent metal transporter [Opitutales bacterium]